MIPFALPDSFALAAYLALLVCILTLWAPPKWWLSAFAAAIALGYAGGVLYGPAVLWIALLGGACVSYRLARNRIAVVLAAAAIVILALAMGTHVAPGFRNFLVTRDIVLSEGAMPYTLYLNFDKASVGILILGIGATDWLRSVRDWVHALRRAAPVIAGNIVLLSILGVAIGYLDFDPKWRDFFWIWATANLLITCMSEEAFFRAFIQRGLAETLHGRAAWIAVGASALLFGIAHFAGGALYVALAIIAGAGYALVYHLTKRIEMAILAHFCLNAVHFLLFTYPRTLPA